MTETRAESAYIDETSNETAVLLLTPTGRDATLAAKILRQFDLHCVTCASAAELLQHLAKGAGAVVLAAEALKEDEARRLNNLLEQQPQWSEVPVILLVAATGAASALDGILMRRNITVLHRPMKVATFVTMLHTALQSRKRQYEVRDLLQQLERRAQQLQKLVLELTQAEERERQKLALLPKQLREESFDKGMQDLAELLQEAIAKARSMSHDLSPPTLQQHGLQAALHWLAERMQKLHSLQVEVQIDAAAEPEHMPLKVFLYRAAQEFLFNVVKHGKTDRAELHLSREDGNIVLSIRDRGAGFDPRQLQSDDDHHGWGLFSINERVKLLDGQLDVNSAPGHGSTFVLTIPLQLDTARKLMQQEEHSVLTAHLGPAAKPRSQHLLRVMLVDDHSVLRSGLSTLLSEEDDIQVVAEAGNGAEAVALAQQLQPDLILMDVAMPGMDGIEATRLIKQQNPNVRIIGLSMLNDSETAAKIEEAGAEKHLCKTEAGANLLMAIRGAAASDE